MGEHGGGGRRGVTGGGEGGGEPVALGGAEHVHVIRDGLGEFNGTWNSGSGSQAEDRDGLINACPP